jgi:hypothetical protein
MYVKAHSSLIKQHAARILHRWIALVKALLLSGKKIYLDFSVLEKLAKNTKNPYFWLPQQKMGSMEY